nr:hypothetical protein [Tanacetum cinerariifolium]
MVATTKLLVLNPNEFELWKIRIKHYFLMIDYALWEVILNGDSPLLIRSVKGVETPYPPTTVEEKLARRNELKARGTLLIALLNECQLKFNSYKNAKSLMEAIEKRFGFNTAHGVFVANSKTNAYNLTNVDSLSDPMIYSFFASQFNSPQLDIEDLKQIDPDDLKEMDLKWKCMATKHQDNGNREAPRRTMLVEDTTSNALVSLCDRLGYDWSDQAKDGPTNFALMAYTSLSSSSSDTKVSTYFKDCLKSYETLKEHYNNLKKDFNKSQFNLGAYKAGLESVKARLEAITELGKKIEKAKKERDDLKLNLEKFQDSSKNLSRLLDSQQSDKSKTGLVYGSHGFDSPVLEIQENDKTSKGYHAVPHYTGNFMPPKPDLVLVDEHVVSESVTSLPNIVQNEVKTSDTTLKNVSALIIKDWVSGSEDEDEIETESNQIKPSFARVKLLNLLSMWNLLGNLLRKKRIIGKPITLGGLLIKEQRLKNNDLKEKVNTVKGKVTTARTKAVVIVVQGNGKNAVKSSAC